MFRPDLIDETNTYESTDSEPEFEPSESGKSVVALYGMVSDIQKVSTHYGAMHRFILSAWCGEPFQLAKTGGNRYGETASYVTFRLNSLEGDGQSRNIMCCNDRIDLVNGDEVEINAYRKRDGSYIANTIYVVNTQTTINARAFTIPATVVRVLAVGALIMAAFLVYCAISIIIGIADFFANGGLGKILNALMPLVLIVVGIGLIGSSLFKFKGWR